MAELAIHHVVPMPNSKHEAHMYSLGFGTWQSDPEKVKLAVLTAIKSGYRLIDCARIYCNQKKVGEALKEAFDTKLVSRKDLFIVSKVWNTDHAPEDVIASTKQTIKDLQCDYLDLLLIHWPVAWKLPNKEDMWKDDPKLLFPSNDKGGSPVVNIPLIDTYKGMETLAREGLVKDLGLANCTLKQTEDIMTHCSIKLAALQIECHVGLPQDELREYCHKNGIAIMGYSPLAVGMNDPKTGLIHNPDIIRIAKEEYGEEGMEATMLLQWVTQRGFVCLSKSVTPKRIEENAHVPFSPLSEKTIKALDEVSKKLMAAGHVRVCNRKTYYEEGGIPFFSDG